MVCTMQCACALASHWAVWAALNAVGKKKGPAILQSQDFFSMRGRLLSGLAVTSHVDSGGTRVGGDLCQASSASESSDEDVRHSSDSEGLFGMDVSETCLGGLSGEEDSDGFSNDAMMPVILGGRRAGQVIKRNPDGL